MVITYKHLLKLEFPIYILPHDDWSFSDGLLFLDGKVVDDTNMEGNTIGKRRLQTPFTDLFPLRSQLDSFQGLLKQNKNTFIDSNGIPFIYEKTIRCDLRYYRIHKKELRDDCCVLWLVGVHQPFTVPRPPEREYSFAGVLLLGGLPWVLYDYSQIAKKDTWRKV
jgi:hypothetical protein